MMMVIMVLVLTYVDKHRKITMKEAKCCIHCFEVCGNGRICVFDRASQNLMIPMQQQQQQQPIAVGVRVLKLHTRASQAHTIWTSPIRFAANLHAPKRTTTMLCEEYLRLSFDEEEEEEEEEVVVVVVVAAVSAADSTNDEANDTMP
jgi:hypothetical protein